jgi:hypothetical protein
MPQPTIEFMIVCVPDGETPQTLTDGNLLGTTALPVTRLWVQRRLWFWQRRDLFRVYRGRKGSPTLCAGAPLRRLDLHALRSVAGMFAGSRWQQWQQTVKGTREARPWHVFEAAHLADPAKLPLAKAKAQFLAQPRINAMRMYNAANPAAAPLDPYEVEMYQAGQHAYQTYHMLRAVCGDAMQPPTGPRMQPASDSLADRITYLGQAWNLLRALDRRRHILAVTP